MRLLKERMSADEETASLTVMLALHHYGAFLVAQR